MGLKGATTYYHTFPIGKYDLRIKTRFFVDLSFLKKESY